MLPFWIIRVVLQSSRRGVGKATVLTENYSEAVPVQIDISTGSCFPADVKFIGNLPSDAPARCKPGDIWQLGPHPLIWEMPATQRPSRLSWRGNSLNWSSPTRRTMCELTVTSAASGRSGIGSSPWPQAK
jgi:hypothetical protein